MATTAPSAILYTSCVFIYVPVNEFLEVFCDLSAERVMPFPICHLFCSHLVNTENKEIEGHKFQLCQDKLGLKVAKFSFRRERSYSSCLFGEWVKTCSCTIHGFESQSDIFLAREREARLHSVFDNPKSADIHLYSTVCTVLKDRLSDPLGFHLFSNRS